MLEDSDGGYIACPRAFAPTLQEKKEKICRVCVWKIARRKEGEKKDRRCL
jgi:predicted GNAT family N-acyltransferase